MAVQTVVMAKDKKKPTAKPDEAYRKAFKPARIRGRLAQAATDHAAELEQDFTQYVNDAVRMRLEAEGRWPPPADAS